MNTIARGGLGPGSVRRLVAVMNALSFPSCVPFAACVIVIGTACIAGGWWSVLPAILPGDDVFNAERVAALTLRALIGWQQPPDAPPMPTLATTGIGIDIGGLLILFGGAVLRFLRPALDAALAARARDVRLVVVDDAAAAVVAAEASAWTNVLLGDASIVASRLHALHARLDQDFLSGTLPRIAASTRELLALGVDADANLDLARRLVALRRQLAPAEILERLYVRIDPRELRRSIGRDGLSEFADAADDSRLTSLPEARCRRLLRDQPPNKVRIMDREGRAAITVIGLGETGLELLVQLCAQAQSPSCDPLTIVLVDTEAPAIARELLDLWPGLAVAAELSPLALEPRLPQSAIALFRHLHAENLVPTCVYVALEDPALSAAWEREISTAVRFTGRESPLVLTVDRHGEADHLLLAEEEVTDLLQRRLHADFLGRWHDGAPADSTSRTDWCHLPFDYQEDNRSVADHLWTKAQDLNLRIVRTEFGVPATIDDANVEELAAAEHRRWVASRAVAGWHFGASRSESERTHPSIVPWAQLIESEREKNRDLVREIPVVLAAAGLALQPLLNVSVPRNGPTESSADALVDLAQSFARSKAGALSHLIIAVEDARSFRLAHRLSKLPDVAFSLILAQPMSGLAVAAGMQSQDAAKLAKAARTLWITRPDSLDAILARWPPLSIAV